MKSEARHDFIGGYVIERPGDTATHNTIVGNCLMAFRQALQHSENQEVYALGILLVLRENEYYTYPNLLVCGEEEGASEIVLIRRPQLLLDVSNPETDDDRGRKFKQYRQLPSLQHHVIVARATLRYW